ncbi:lytic murein transglycosylase [Falsihalocynthiibacter sp. S25ZX9]|uniref:lytic murein transglycosylase n=1 Tax=unclassified Falsihalocynthiibacter TaxID=2854191 RepID=UPI00350F5AE4
MFFRAPLAAFFLSLLSTTAMAQNQCGGDFGQFVANMKQEATARGHSKSTVDAFFASVKQDPRTLKADRSQGIFKKDFNEFARAVISKNRMDHGRNNEKKYDAVFDQMEQQYGVSRGVLLAFWALETDYGAVQGDFNTLNSLVTLSHDCRRPNLFRPQVFAAIELFERGNFSPTNTTGAWAGEVGMVQMLPEDIIRNGVDGDGDGKVSLKTSPPDALLSGAKMLKGLGWNAGQPWLQEIVVPSNLDWSKTGLDKSYKVSDWKRMGVKARSANLGSDNLEASILLPMGRNGPAFLAYPNFHVYFEWNKSFVYVTTAAYFATRLEGAPVFNLGSPDPSLSDAQMKSLQKKLSARGHDVGKIDGILGAKTRAGVQLEQQRLGLPADAWPTNDLVNKL